MTDTVDSLKQRLVGAFVIVTLAIIFLPMIFDKPHQAESIVLVPVPPKPDYRTIEISKPSKPTFTRLVEDESGKVVKQNKSISKDEIVSRGAVQPSEAPLPEVDSKKPPKPTVNQVATSTVRNISVFNNVWMVQLGTFNNIKNAYRLRDKLRNDGFDAHTRTISLNGKKAVKVYSGPFVKKRDAIKIKKRLDKKYKVDSRVVFFDAK